MSSTASQLRRSKRNQASSTNVEKAPIPTSKATTDDATVPRKRSRKATVEEDTTANTQVPKKHKPSTSPVPSPDPLPTRPQPTNQPLPPLLALPRELRDEIYKHILEQDASTTLKRGSKSSSRNLATRCGLVGVNNQLCEEFLDAVLFHAPVITTTVRNHNFAHVVTFLNRLSQAQLARLSSRGAGFTGDEDDARGKRKIQIILSYSAGAKDSRAHLNRWLDRFDVSDKRGKEIEFVYDGDGTYQNGGYKQRPKTRAMASARWNEEARKIGQAAARAGRASGGWGGWW